MASAKNKVIAGDYEGKSVSEYSKQIVIKDFTGILKPINDATIEGYEIITEDIRKSGSSAILRGALGSMVFGPAGLLAGVSAKNKGIYNIAIQFKDGKKSLIEIDDKLYKILIKNCF